MKSSAFEAEGKPLIQTEVKKEYQDSSPDHLDSGDSLDAEGDAEDAAEANLLWAETFGVMSPKQWRKYLAEFLQLVSDLEEQKGLFISKTRKSPLSQLIELEHFFDLSQFYFTFLNLELGMKHALQMQFLSLEEVKIIHSFDQKMRAYTSDDYFDDEKYSVDPRWIEVCGSACDLLLDFVPRLKER